MDTYTLIETLVVTVMAALLGLSLPLILQTIERLDAKYGSTVLSSAFRNSFKFKCYFWMVWIAIGLMIYLPWAPKPMECLKDSWVANSAHILAWLSLALTLGLLLFVFRDIMTFESPDKLLKKLTDLSPNEPGGSDHKIQSLISNKDIFDQFGTLMKYSMTVGNTGLFLNCNSVLGSCIGLCRKDSHHGEQIVYPDSIYNLINEALRISQRFYDELLYPVLNNPQTFLDAYFDSYCQTTLSQNTLRQLWVNLGMLSRCNKPEWIKGYWVYASQYADYTVAQRIIISAELYEIEQAYKKEEEISGFAEDIRDKWNTHQNYVEEANALRLFHHMFCAYLMHEQKSDLVKWTFTYTPSSLRTLFLIPRSISTIVLELVEIDRNPFLLDVNFSFFSEEGIDTGYLMRDWLMKYYILAINEPYDLFIKGIVCGQQSFRRTQIRAFLH